MRPFLCLNSIQVADAGKRWRFFLVQWRRCSASHLQKSMNELKESPNSRYRWYRFCDRVSFFGLTGSPTMEVPRKHPLLSHFTLCQPHEHLSLSLPLPPLLHSQQAVHRRPLLSLKLCMFLPPSARLICGVMLLN